MGEGGGGGGGGSTTPLDRGGTRYPKKFVLPFGPQFSLKMGGGGAFLDPSLTYELPSQEPV